MTIRCHIIPRFTNYANLAMTCDLPAIPQRVEA